MQVWMKDQKHVPTGDLEICVLLTEQELVEMAKAGAKSGYRTERTLRGSKITVIVEKDACQAPMEPGP